MTKQIEIIERSSKLIEVDVPSFLNEHGVRIAITDQSIIRVWPDNTLVSFIPASDKERYSEIIAEIFRFTPKPTPISQQEFVSFYNNTIKCLTEQYQLSMNMKDPGTQTAEGQQATEETNAQESASQDKAMEVNSEEGSTEG